MDWRDNLVGKDADYQSPGHKVQKEKIIDF